MLGTLQASIPEDSLGYLEDLTHCVMHGKSYLHLLNPGRPVCTYVLCNRTESSLEELKVSRTVEGTLYVMSGIKGFTGHCAINHMSCLEYYIYFTFCCPQYRPY